MITEEQIKLIKKMLVKTKKSYNKANGAENDLFNYIEECLPDDIDLESIDTNAENARNLREAIMCHCHYNEYSIKEIIKELQAI